MSPFAPRYRIASLVPNLWQLTELGLFNVSSPAAARA